MRVPALGVAREGAPGCRRVAGGEQWGPPAGAVVGADAEEQGCPRPGTICAPERRPSAAVKAWASEVAAPASRWLGSVRVAQSLIRGSPPAPATAGPSGHRAARKHRILDQGQPAGARNRRVRAGTGPVDSRAM
ncbi:hypothetical protein AQJ11_13790 [Streptomyces corchorusii]|uniref:Uncharacterized protein n=1 Tax=Streptomyces corchorusii TaxID=1903 RepID=A0A101QD14_STRCK|nr:hypothetical protein AQJ11_13790 [Streptomyces corchorusii]